jgi:cell division protein FtsA
VKLPRWYWQKSKAGFEHKLRAGIVLTGGTAKIHGIENIFREVTGMYVQIGKPKNLERTNSALHDALINDPSYTTALGLAWSSVKPLDKRVVKAVPQFRKLKVKNPAPAGIFLVLVKV